MKILHTADLHLGKHWGGTSLLPDQVRILDEILSLCEQRDVDMLLIAGDVFAESTPGNRPLEIAQGLLSRLLPALERGRTVFLLRGNHDSFKLFELLSFVLTRLAGKDSLPLVVASRPGIYRLPGRDAEVIAVPYVTPSWLKNEVSPPGVTPREELVGLAGQLSMYVRGLCERVSPGVPSIFAAHVMIDHAELRSDVQVEEGYVREVVLHASDLPQFTSYNALGHIHLGQEVRGAGKPTWYSGAPDRLDLGERGYRPQVLLVTTPDTPGGVAKVEPIPMTGCTTWVKQDLHGEAGVRHFCENINGADPIGQVMVDGVTQSQRLEIEALIHTAAPRLVIQWAVATMEDGGQANEGLNPNDVFGTVTAFLQKAFAQDAGRRDRLLAAFDDLWNRSDGVSA